MPVDHHPPLTKEQEHQYNKALVSTNKSGFRAELLDRNRQVVRRLGNIQDGQVDLDCTATTSIWSGTLTVMDPGDHLKLDTDVLFLDRLARVVHWIYVPEMGQVVETDVGCGPCNAPSTAGPVVTLEFQGMELWARGSIRHAQTWKKGARVTDVIRAILIDHIGETAKWLDIPDLGHRLPDDYQAKIDTDWWSAATYLADSIDCDLFYGRDSKAVLRPRGSQAVYVITDEAVVGQPQLSTVLGGSDTSGSDVSSIRNRFVVVGKAKPVKPPKSGKAPKPPRIIGFWNVPAGNRFSAEKLGHPNTPLWLRDLYENAHIHEDTTANRIARNRGRRALQFAERATVSTVVVPHLNAFDAYRITASGAGVAGRYELMQASIPLRWSQSNPMTWGFTRRVSRGLRRDRR